MQQNPILVYLHGKGADSSSNSDLMKALAARHHAELISFNAPFPHKRGFMWFGKISTETGRRIINDQFTQSAAYIRTQIESILLSRNSSWSNLILCGHSQGGVMALFLGLAMNAAEVISICGDFPAELTGLTTVNPKVPLYWIEAGRDTFLSLERKNSWKWLSDKGCDLRFRCSPLSTHQELNPEILDLIDLF